MNFQAWSINDSAPSASNYIPINSALQESLILLQCPMKPCVWKTLWFGSNVLVSAAFSRDHVLFGFFISHLLMMVLVNSLWFLWEFQFLLLIFSALSKSTR